MKNCRNINPAPTHTPHKSSGSVSALCQSRIVCWAKTKEKTTASLRFFHPLLPFLKLSQLSPDQNLTGRMRHDTHRSVLRQPLGRSEPRDVSLLTGPAVQSQQSEMDETKTRDVRSSIQFKASCVYALENCSTHSIPSPNVIQHYSLLLTFKTYNICYCVM